MSPVIQQWACCGLVAGSRGWESHSRLQLSLAGRKEGCLLSTAFTPLEPGGVIVGVGFLDLKRCVCVKVEWICISCLLYYLDDNSKLNFFCLLLLRLALEFLRFQFLAYFFH